MDTNTNNQLKQTVDNHNNVENAVNHVRRLPQEQQNQVIQKLEMYSGPIPSPHILKEYDEMDPGAAKQIIDNGVEESHHRRQMESRMLDMNRKRGIRRDWMGFTIGFIAILVGAFLIYKDHYVVGTIFSGISILGLVGQFLNDDDSNDSSKNKQDDNSNDVPESN